MPTNPTNPFDSVPTVAHQILVNGKPVMITYAHEKLDFGERCNPLVSKPAMRRAMVKQWRLFATRIRQEAKDLHGYTEAQVAYAKAIERFAERADREAYQLERGGHDG